MFDTVLVTFDRRRDRDTTGRSHRIVGSLDADHDQDDRRAPGDRRRADRHDDDGDEAGYRRDCPHGRPFDRD